MVRLILSVFATYAVTLILTESTGPKGIFAKLRGKNYFKALSCLLCTSIYIGAVFALYTARSPLEWLITALALAGAATFLDRFYV